MAEWASTDRRGAAKLAVDDATGDYEDSYTPSAGVGSSVRKMLGLRGGDEEPRRVLPVLLEEIFGEFYHAIGGSSSALCHSEPILTVSLYLITASPFTFRGIRW